MSEIPANEHLRLYSGEHIAKSVEIFFAAAAELFRNEETMNLNVRNALMDSFRIHARSLLFFFYSNNFKKDDAQAQHFMDEATNWNEVRPPQSEVLIDLQRRVGKEVAHLTYTRPLSHREDDDWNFGEMMAELWMVIRSFAYYADSNKLHENVKTSLKFWLDVFWRDGTFKVDPTSLPYSVSMWTSAGPGSWEGHLVKSLDHLKEPGGLPT